MLAIIEIYQNAKGDKIIQKNNFQRREELFFVIWLNLRKLVYQSVYQILFHYAFLAYIPLVVFTVHTTPFKIHFHVKWLRNLVIF